MEKQITGAVETANSKWRRGTYVTLPRDLDDHLARFPDLALKVYIHLYVHAGFSGANDLPPLKGSSW